jgi:hypothetical protein
VRMRPPPANDRIDGLRSVRWLGFVAFSATNPHHLRRAPFFSAPFS